MPDTATVVRRVQQERGRVPRRIGVEFRVRLTRAQQLQECYSCSGTILPGEVVKVMDGAPLCPRCRRC